MSQRMTGSAANAVAKTMLMAFRSCAVALRTSSMTGSLRRSLVGSGSSERPHLPLTV